MKRFGPAAALLFASLGVGQEIQNVPISPVLLEVPGRPFALAVDLPGFTVGTTRTATAERTERRAAHEDTGVMVTMVVERADDPVPRDAAASRERLWSRLKKSAPPGTEIRDVRRSERDGKAILEYSVPAFGDPEKRQRNVHVLLVRETVVARVHLSLAPYDPAAEPDAFDAIVDSIRFVERASE